MRSTSVRFLSLLGLLIFGKLTSAVSQAPSLASKRCAPEDPECHRTSVPKEQHGNVAVSYEERDWIDVPWLDTEAGLVRLDPAESLYSNDVHCWPSVGGIIIGQRVHAVELAYIGLDRFYTTPRSSNETEEDAFCMQLRKIGGKWWRSYDDFEMATGSKVRRMWPDEREVLFLGWPEQGGVWVLRYDNWKMIRGDLGPVWNALSMEERCMALENRGAVFFENPEESEYVRPLLKGFGDREERRDPDVEDGGWWDHGYEL
ncbi:hypothetical protein EG329_005178 [Mollisiaceae sp. DMI_Dod_QoI]|nr:hypothetical protein EG329_005178 [Helotiales sp. DMI_Dod_QoI]